MRVPVGVEMWRGLMLGAWGACWLAGQVLAHCDTANGPVIPEAKEALESGDVTPVLKWVQPADEAQIKAAFATALAARGGGGDVPAQAEQRFLEELVRVHRAGEGAPFTGIKDEPVDPIVAMADASLAEGSVEDMVHAISGHMAASIREKFARVQEAAAHKDESVSAGREYVAAYVTYMHYVEGVHAAIAASGGHAHGGDTPHEAPAEAGHDVHVH
ncbi:MAG: DUF6448 family protein [Lentisphaerae bacterium]|nr:DUF6448 family protein [Lentisphaerota bacterium]